MLITILRKPMCIELKVIYSKTNNKNMKFPKKGLIILATARGVLADFWVPNEIDS